MSVTAKSVLAGVFFSVCFAVACELPERPTVVRISKPAVFRPSTPNEINTVEQAVSTIVTIVRDDLHLPTVDPLIVYIYNNDVSFSLFGPGRTVSMETSQIAAGARGNELHVKMTAFKMNGLKDLPLGHFLEVFAHEYAHNLQHTISTDPPRVPEWFSEGFAGWLAAKVLHSLGWQDYEISVHRALRELAHHRDIVPYLSWLEEPKSWNRQSAKAKGAVRAYVPATVAVHRLVEKQGLSSVMNYFRTADFDKSFRISLNDFSTEFDNYVAQLGAQKQVAFKMDRPNWKIGDHWLYARKVSGKQIREKREIVNETLFRSTPCFVAKVGKEEVFYTKDTLSLLANMEDGKLMSSRDKPNMVLNWPLEQDKEWRNSYKFQDFKRRIHGKVDQSIIVSNLERVSVPAGVFDSSKVEAYDSETGRLVAEYWYSPKAKWMVKARLYVGIDGFTEDELVSFNVNEEPTI